MSHSLHGSRYKSNNVLTMDELQLPQTCPYYPTKFTIEQQPIISFGILKNPKAQKEKKGGSKRYHP